MPMLKMIALALVALGVLLLLLGTGLLLRKLFFSRRAQRANGIVTRCERDSANIGDSGSWLYRPTVRFQRSDGAIVDYTPAIASNNANYPVGAPITVLYDPQFPAKVILGEPSSFKFWLGSIVLLLTGTVFIGVGLLMFLIANGQGESLFRILL